MRVLFSVPWPVRVGHFWFCQNDTHGECLPCLRRGYLVALGLFLCTVGVQGVGVFLTHGLSLEGDTWHVASDALGALLGFVALRRVHRTLSVDTESVSVSIPEYYRALMILLLFVSSVVIFQKVIGRLFFAEPVELVFPGVMLGVASLGLVVNCLVLGIYRGLRIQHTHGGKPCCHAEKSSVSQDLLKGNTAHALQDALSSLLVIILSMGLIGYPHPAWVWVDGVISFFIGLWLLRIGWEIHEASLRKQ